MRTVPLLPILLVYLIIINVAAFVVFAIDKHAAIKHKTRIREATLFGLALAGGSIGALGGMYAFRHKTQKKAFIIGIPLILLFQATILTLVLIYYSRLS